MVVSGCVPITIVGINIPKADTAKPILIMAVRPNLACKILKGTDKANIENPDNVTKEAMKVDNPKSAFNSATAGATKSPNPVMAENAPNIAKKRKARALFKARA